MKIDKMNPQMNKLNPFIVMDVLEKANEMQAHGENIIHLEVGEPDFDMPACVVEGMQQALVEGKTHYTHSLGEPILRQSIAESYQKEYGVTVDPDCIVITSGSSPAILMVIMLLCEVGGEVLFSNPGYACYHNFILACNGIPVEVPLSAENGFQFDIDEIKKRITPKTRALFINSPMNPTGTLVDESVMKELAQLNIPIISDEIYHGLVYEGKAHSMLEFTDDAFILNGFSKKYAMTGLRLGYLIAPKRYMRTLQTLQQNLFICAPSVTQYAGLAALQKAAKDVEVMRETYNERRLYMINRLKSMGFIIHSEPQGAFYVFADARKFTNDVYKFSFDVLEKAHVGITPGIDFGTNGEGFVRFSYANSIDNIKIAMDRLEAYLNDLKK